MTDILIPEMGAPPAAPEPLPPAPVSPPFVPPPAIAAVQTPFPAPGAPVTSGVGGLPPLVPPKPVTDPKAKQKAAHIVTVTPGKPKNGMAFSTGNDGTPIPRDGPLTIALIETKNPGVGSHPGADIDCVARLPDKSEIGDLVEVYCVPGLTGPSALIHPPKGESIGPLPVSTGDNVGTCVEVPASAGRLFRKTSASAWHVTGA
jgi:hypothetical protein